MELPRRISDELRCRSLAKGHRVRLEFRGRTGIGAGRRDGAEPERGVRTAVFPQKATIGHRRNVCAGSVSRVSGRKRTMASLAEKRVSDSEDGPADPQARPEELRL